MVIHLEQLHLLYFKAVLVVHNCSPEEVVSHQLRTNYFYLIKDENKSMYYFRPLVNLNTGLSSKYAGRSQSFFYLLAFLFSTIFGT